MGRQRSPDIGDRLLVRRVKATQLVGVQLLHSARLPQPSAKGNHAAPQQPRHNRRMSGRDDRRPVTDP